MTQLARNAVYIPVCPGGHRKSLLDTPRELRALLADTGVHNYFAQEPGKEHAVRLPIRFIERWHHHDTTISLYRPKTKGGAMCRFWVWDLRDHMDPGEVLGIVVRDGQLYAFNASDRHMVLRLYEEGLT